MTLSMSLFSIITVVLNPGKDDLRKSVESVLSQNEDWEMIIKDGGSVDQSLECLPNDDRIKVFCKGDSGIFDAMNQALEMACGEFVCFLNAGDYFHSPHALTRVKQAIMEKPDVGLYYGNVRKLCSRAGVNTYPKRLSRRYLFMHSVCHQCWFVRRDIYLKYGGFDNITPVGADQRLLLRMILSDQVPHAHVDHVLVCYKGQGYSSTHENRKLRAEYHNKLKKELYKPLEYYGYSSLDMAWKIGKKLFYDHILYRPIRLYYSFRYGDMQS